MQHKISKTVARVIGSSTKAATHILCASGTAHKGILPKRPCQQPMQLQLRKRTWSSCCRSNNKKVLGNESGARHKLLVEADFLCYRTLTSPQPESFEIFRQPSTYAMQKVSARRVSVCCANFGYFCALLHNLVAVVFWFVDGAVCRWNARPAICLQYHSHMAAKGCNVCLGSAEQLTGIVSATGGDLHHETGLGKGREKRVVVCKYKA